MKESRGAPELLAERLTNEHREIDELFGRFLAAAHAGDAAAAARAIGDFDERLRRHTAQEEQDLYPAPTAGKLAAPALEGERDRLVRELLLEHVQVRELTGILRRLLEEKQDLESARRLAGNLARRWDTHTTREERELPGLAR